LFNIDQLMTFSGFNGTSGMKKKIRATICDVDGVITQTAKLHARAWKKMFDQFLQEWSKKNQKNFAPFEVMTDYPQWVDGKPRMEGVKSFLQSRHIQLPMGDSEDAAGTYSIWGLSKKKNAIFLHLLSTEKIATFADTVAQLQQWKARGMKIAAVSASKNCRQVLQAAGLSEFFATVVDGIIQENQHLKGKPQPDTFLYAASLLEVAPEYCLVLEDAAAGIAAAKSGGFGLAAGVLHPNNETVLHKTNADVLMTQLRELFWTGVSIRYPQNYVRLPNILSTNKIPNKRPVAVFLDYDGTITPIAPRPEQALLAEDMRQTIAQLAGKAQIIAVVSGRDNDNLKSLVKLSNIFYIGNHGYDIEGPANSGIHYQAGLEFVPFLTSIAQQIEAQLKTISGVQLEPKKFTYAVHYRHVDENNVQTVVDRMREIIQHYPQLKMGYGKKVLEVRPNIDWDKGKAVQWVMEKMKLDPATVCPIYLGDDLTDEDAFRSLPEQGIGILVGNHSEYTYADYGLTDPAQVNTFLNKLNEVSEK